MKKFLLFILLFPLVCYSQTWKYQSGGSDFDGKYKSAYITGVGNEFPYNKPIMAINKFDKNDGFNFYISDAGYSQEGIGLSVLFVFSNEPDTVYSTYDFSISNDGKTIFLKEFNDPNSDTKISQVEFIKKLQDASKVSVRVKDNYSQNDLVFSLSGSTNAINYVIPDLDNLISTAVNERNKKLEIANLERENSLKIKAEKENEQIARKELFNLLMAKANDEKLSIGLSSLELKIKRDLGVDYYDGMETGKKYESITVEGKAGDDMFEKYGYVSVFYLLEDGSKEEISGTFSVEMDAPVFNRLAERKEREKEILESLLAKLSLDKIKNHFKKEILNRANRSYRPKFNLEDIKGVSLTFSEYKYNKVWECQVTLFLPNLQKDEFKSYVYDLEISKKELKQAGIQLDIPFKL